MRNDKDVQLISPYPYQSDVDYYIIIPDVSG